MYKGKIRGKGDDDVSVYTKLEKEKKKYQKGGKKLKYTNKSKTIIQPKKHKREKQKKTKKLVIKNTYLNKKQSSGQ